VNAAKLRQLVTSRGFVTSAVSVAVVALAQAGIRVSPTIREDAVNVVTIAAPIALSAYAWMRARIAKKNAAPAEDGTPGSSGAGE
jgi:hypothetical protein